MQYIVHTVPNLLSKYIAKVGQCSSSEYNSMQELFVYFEIFIDRMGLINIHITQGGRRGESSILIIDNKRLLLSSFMSRGLGIMF